jgi:hypothetical protein
MTLESLTERKGSLESSLKNIEQSFHIVTGHLAEVNYQINQLAEVDDEPQVELETEPLVQ